MSSVSRTQGTEEKERTCATCEGRLQKLSPTTYYTHTAAECVIFLMRRVEALEREVAKWKDAFGYGRH